MASANEAVVRVASEAALLGGFELYEVAFLEVAPLLKDAVARLVERGAARVLVVPYFLTLGIHLKRDLPLLVAELEARYEGLAIRVTPPLDGHPGLSRILADRAQEA